MAVFNKPPQHRSWTRALTAVMGISAFAIGLLLWHMLTAPDLATTQNIATLQWWSRVIRLTVILLLGAAWPRLVRHCVPASDARCGEIMRARWRVLAWLLFIELLLAQSTWLPYRA